MNTQIRGPCLDRPSSIIWVEVEETCFSYPELLPFVTIDLNLPRYQKRGEKLKKKKKCICTHTARLPHLSVFGSSSHAMAPHPLEVYTCSKFVSPLPPTPQEHLSAAEQVTVCGGAEMNRDR